MASSALRKERFTCDLCTVVTNRRAVCAQRPEDIWHRKKAAPDACPLTAAPATRRAFPTGSLACWPSHRSAFASARFPAFGLWFFFFLGESFFSTGTQWLSDAKRKTVYWVFISAGVERLTLQKPHLLPAAL